MTKYLLTLCIFVCSVLSAPLLAQTSGLEAPGLRALTHSLFAIQKYRTVRLMVDEPAKYGASKLTYSQLLELENKYLGYTMFSISLLPNTYHNRLIAKLIKSDADFWRQNDTVELKIVRSGLVQIIDKELRGMVRRNQISSSVYLELMGHYNSIGRSSSRKAIIKILLEVT